MHPEGLYYIDNYLSQQEVATVANLLKESNKWNGVTANKSSRRVIHYGYEYAYNRAGITKTDDIPENLQLLDAAKINKLCNKEIITQDFNQLIINEYQPGQGIAAHIDHVKYFGPVIACISIGDICIDFTKGYLKKPLTIESGSLYIMTGPARYEWYHAIEKKLYDGDKKRETRYSLTYRTVSL